MPPLELLGVAHAVEDLHVLLVVYVCVRHVDCSPLISSSAHQAGRGRAPYLLYPMLPDICHTPGLAPRVPILARTQGERLKHNTSS